MKQPPEEASGIASGASKPSLVSASAPSLEQKHVATNSASARTLTSSCHCQACGDGHRCHWALLRRWDVGQCKGDNLRGAYLSSYPRFLLRPMAPSLPISSLLNTSTSERSSDAETLHQIRLIAGLLTWTSPIRAPPHIIDCLSQIVDYFGLATSASPSSAELSNILRAPNSTSTLSPLNAPPTLRHDVRLNCQTTLSTLYTFENIDAYVEYP